MKTKRFSISAITAIAVTALSANAGAQQAMANCARNTSAAVALSTDEQWALNEALQDEYKARATYARVVETFGEVRPFSNIIHAESRHVEALVGLYNQYGVPVPEDTWHDKVPVFGSLEEACAAAVQAELENAALYDGIAVKVGKPDLIRVFAALRDASLSRHLPAFKRHVERGNGRGRGGQGRGLGYGPGQGRGGQGRGLGYGQGQGQGGQGRGLGYVQGQGRGGQGRGLGYGRGQGRGGQGRGLGHRGGQGCGPGACAR